MTKRFMGAALIVVLASGVASADDGAAARGAAGSVRPIWTFAGVAAGFGTGLWVGLTAFDDSVDSDRKVWTSAIVGAAAGGVIGYLIDRHRAKSRPAPSAGSFLPITPCDERDMIWAARRLGKGQLERQLEPLAGSVLSWQLRTDTCRRFVPQKVSSIP